MASDWPCRAGVANGVRVAYEAGGISDCKAGQVQKRSTLIAQMHPLPLPLLSDHIHIARQLLLHQTETYLGRCLLRHRVHLC